MLISEILKGFDAPDCKIIKERPFDTLALCGASPGLKFCTFADSEKYLSSLSKDVVMLITTEETAGKCDTERMGVVVTENPRIFFFLVHNFLAKCDGYVRVQVPSRIAPTAQISEMAHIADYNVTIGERCVIEPFVTIYPNVGIGADTVIRSGARIGGQGFEFKRTDGTVIAVAHVGGVRIGNHVEIQNNTCVDKAIYPWDDTVLEDYVKLDNLVHVAHAVKVGHGTMMAAGVLLGGRVEVAPDTWIGVGATVRNGMTIEKGGRVNMGAVVTQNVHENEAVSGNFAFEHAKFIRMMKKISAVQDWIGGGYSVRAALAVHGRVAA